MKVHKIYPLLLIIPFSILIVITVSCGIYSFSGSTLPGHLKTVAVPLFEDNTSEFGIDQQITDAVIETFREDNSLKITGARNADSIIKGTIVRIEDQAGQYDASETATDFRVTIIVRISFEDVKERKIIWEETLSQWGSYSEERQEGITSAIEKLCGVILNKSVSSW